MVKFKKKIIPVLICVIAVIGGVIYGISTRGEPSDNLANSPPVAQFTYSPTFPPIGDVIQFTDQSTDPDGTIESYSWNFGDGNISTQANPTHYYSLADNYTVALTVTDNGGATDTMSKQIEVRGVPLTWDELSQEEKEFLDNVAEAAFRFFWEEADPTTGLIKDRTPTSPSSIAGVGFGLSAICIGEERGWISYEDAYNRTWKTLSSFYDDPDDPTDLCVEGSHGFFYHFVEMNTGKRTWRSEVSLVDTALLVAGVLHAGQHFKGTPIEDLATKIYEAVEWDWLLLEDGTLSAGWTPENGFLGGWRGYDEFVLPYLLALGSPTHPVPASSWDALTSGYAWTQYGNGDKFLTPDGSFKPIAYIYHYPAAWIDFREKHDEYANYWQNAIRAMKANRQYCIDWAENEENYDNNLWGWTAVYGPDGYQVFGDPFNGTVAPSAVGASIPLIPEYAIQTLRYMYETYGDRIYGEYGFVDGFNVVVDWYDQDYLGINHGSLLLMIEDFRSGLVWDEFMQNEYIIEGMAKAGFVDGFHPDGRGFIRDWLVIGPFGTSADEAFQTDYVGESSMSESPKAGDEYGGETWTEYHSPIGPEECNYIDFNRLFLPNDNVCAYAFVTVVSNRDQNVYLRVGSDDFIKVWINNELVRSNQTVRTAAEDQDIISGVLIREGSNKVLVKVCDVGQDWGFYLRFTDNVGNPIPIELG